MFWAFGGLGFTSLQYNEVQNQSKFLKGFHVLYQMKGLDEHY